MQEHLLSTLMVEANSEVHSTYCKTVRNACQPGAVIFKLFHTTANSYVYFLFHIWLLDFSLLLFVILSLEG